MKTLHRNITYIAIAFAFIFAFMLTACKTDTADPVANARGRAFNHTLIEAGKVLGKVAVSTIVDTVQREATGQKTDFASSASYGVWTNAATIVDASAIQRIIDAYSGGKLPDTATTAAIAFASSSAPPEQTANAIAAVISAAAGAPPAATK